MTVEGGAARTGLVSRVRNILVSPKTEWDVIDAEPATAQGLFTGYTLILALIPLVASILPGLMASAAVNLVGRVWGVGASISPVWIVLEAVKNYVISIIGVLVTALIIDAFASSFGAQRNRIQALKVATYAATAGWVAGFFWIVPLLNILIGIAACIYVAYLIYLGLRQVMHAPEDKAVGYAVVSILVSIVAMIAVALVINIPYGMAKRASGALLGVRDPAVTIRLPDGTRINAKEAEDAIEEIAKNIELKTESGEITINAGPTTEGDLLQSLLPASLPGGYTRTETSSGGMSGLASGAEGVYLKDDSRIELHILDSGALSAVAGIAGGIKSQRTTANGYEKVGQVDGRLTTEEYNRASNSGKYAVMVGDRFMVEAEGSKVTIADLKAAVEAVSFPRLEALSKG